MLWALFESRITMINLNKVSVSLPACCGDDASIEIDLAAMPAHILQSLLEHGLKQKVADAAADSKKFETAADAFKACQDITDRLLAGTWALKGGGAKITTFEAYVKSKATAAAKARMEKDPKAAAKGLEYVVEAYSKNEPLRVTWLAEWNARQAAKKTDVEID
jgi:hypothetical protein